MTLCSLHGMSLKWSRLFTPRPNNSIPDRMAALLLVKSTIQDGPLPAESPFYAELKARNRGGEQLLHALCFEAHAQVVEAILLAAREVPILPFLEEGASGHSAASRSSGVSVL